MKTTPGFVVALLVTFAALLSGAGAAGGKITIVAAENFYGDVAQQIGGDAGFGHQHPEQSRPGPASVRDRAHPSCAKSPRPK